MSCHIFKSDQSISVLKNLFKDFIVPLINEKEDKALEIFLNFYCKRMNEMYGDETLSLLNKGVTSIILNLDKKYRNKENGFRDIKSFILEYEHEEPDYIDRINSSAKNFRTLIIDMIRQSETKYKPLNEDLNNYKIAYTRSTDLELRIKDSLSPLIEQLHWRGKNIVGYTEIGIGNLYAVHHPSMTKLFLARSLLDFIEAFDSRISIYKLIIDRCAVCGKYFVIFKKKQLYCSEVCSIKGNNRKRPKKKR